MVSWRGPRRIIRQEHADRPGDGCQGWSGARWTWGRGDRPAGSEVGERHRAGDGVGRPFELRRGSCRRCRTVPAAWSPRVRVVRCAGGGRRVRAWADRSPGRPDGPGRRRAERLVRPSEQDRVLARSGPEVGGATRRGDRGGALRQLPGSGQSGGVPRHVRLDGELRNADREDEGGGGRTHSTGWSPGRPAASAGGRGGWSRRVVAGWAAEA